MSEHLFGYNRCMQTARDALRYLAENNRPRGGQELYNSEHLYQIANELAKTAKEIASPATPCKSCEGLVRVLHAIVAASGRNPYATAASIYNQLPLIENVAKQALAEHRKNGEGK